jgi:hypothetical protein
MSKLTKMAAARLTDTIISHRAETAILVGTAYDLQVWEPLGFSSFEEWQAEVDRQAVAQVEEYAAHPPARKARRAAPPGAHDPNPPAARTRPAPPRQLGATNP